MTFAVAQTQRPFPFVDGGRETFDNEDDVVGCPAVSQFVDERINGFERTVRH